MGHMAQILGWGLIGEWTTLLQVKTLLVIDGTRTQVLVDSIVIAARYMFNIFSLLGFTIDVCIMCQLGIYSKVVGHSD